MDLEFKRFTRDYFSEYAAWFADADLNRHLGPMDDEWLECVLAETDSEGEIWAVFRDAQMVAVVECMLDLNDRTPMISALATKPVLRRQGIGTATLRRILELHNGRGLVEHTAIVAADNLAALRCATKAGFILVSPQPDRHGYLQFRRKHEAMSDAQSHLSRNRPAAAGPPSSEPARRGEPCTYLSSACCQRAFARSGM